MTRLRTCAATAVLLAAAAAAAAPSDFARQWPLLVDGHDGLLALTLPAEVYAQLQRDDLGDLVVFNGAGEPVPFGPLAPPRQRTRTLQPEPVAVPLFAVQRAGAASGEGIALHIARAADGRLTRLDADLAPAAPGAATDLLLDLSSLEQPVSALLLELDSDTGAGSALDARVAVEGSDDLGRWRPLASGLAVVSLREGGLRLERRRLEIPATRHDYLRIRRTDAAAALPVRGVRAVPAPVEAGLLAPPSELLTLEGTAAEGAVGTFDYRSDGPYPVAQVDVALADRNATAQVTVLSRSAPDRPWRERARFTAFRLGGEAEADGVGNAPVPVGSVRDREWRVATEPPQARAPRLRLAWTPDRFLLLTQGEPPYVLAAGSARATRADHPVTTVLAELQSRHGADWQPPAASLGEGRELAGDAARVPAAEPVPLRQWVLWGVLVLGAALLVFMVVRLLRQPPPSR